MKSNQRQYLFALVFVAISAFQLYAKDYEEFALYIAAALAFAVNAMSMDAKFEQYKKPLVIASWTLIIITGIFFLYLLRTKWF